MKFIKYPLIILFLGFLGPLNADVLQIKPYTQWTFDTPVEQVVFMENIPGVPIYMIRTRQHITLYDSTGNEFRKIERTEGDHFVLSSDNSGFMLVQDQQLANTELAEHLYSFQVFKASGAADYTSVHAADFASGKLDYQLTGDRNIILTERGKPWLLEISKDDTLLYFDSVLSTPWSQCSTLVIAKELKLQHEMITASSCILSDSVAGGEVELRLWDHDQSLGSPIKLKGELQGMQTIPGTDYFFLETAHGSESTLSLFDRTNGIRSFPWKSWEIRPLGRDAAFIISEEDLNIINLGDGVLAASFHPNRLRGISDAAYMAEYAIFLYLRYQLFFTEEGHQAFRNFVMEGVNQAGELIYRSSFGTWSEKLPKITPMGKDLFAIHIHNAVLVYRIELEQD